MNSNTAYQLLYYSSHPEDGEWVCVGLLIEQHAMFHLEFDESLSKLRCIARDQDVEYVRGVLTELGRCFSTREAAGIAKNMEPQFRLSKERTLVAPATSEIIERLKRRFLMRWRASSVSRVFDDEIRAKIEQFITYVAPDARSRLRTGVRPTQVVGAELGRTFLIQRPIAHALVSRTRAIIFDGIDTSVGTPAVVIQRTNNIAFNFWQYRHAYDSAQPTEVAPKSIVKVAFIYDGRPDRKKLSDYAFHEFKDEAEHTLMTPQRADPRLMSDIQQVMEDQPVVL